MPRDPLTFGLTLRHGVDPADDAAGFAALVRRADELGVDVLSAGDHLGAMAPFPALVAAGSISPRLRLRTYVLNVLFWNPALLAREVATADVLTGGRVELGLGSGHMRHEVEDAGLSWLASADRWRRASGALDEVRRRIADPEHRPRPVQHPVPIMIGAMSEAGLDLAAREADLVGISGLYQAPGQPPGTFTLASAAETDQRVAAVRTRAAGRPYRTEMLVQTVVLGAEPERSAAEFSAAVDGRIDVATLLDSPFVLFATDADAAAAELERRRVRYGLDEITVHQPALEALGEVIAARRGTGAVVPQ